MSRKRKILKWTGITFLTIIFLIAVFTINLIWFKPISIRMFYDKIFVEFTISSPELVTSMGIPVLYDRTKGHYTNYTLSPKVSP